MIPIKYEFLTMEFPHESKLEMLIARDDAGRIAGTVTCKNLGKRVEFNRLYVSNGHRESGVGKGIIEFIAVAARTAGAESLTGFVHPENKGALAFYRKLGFVEATRFDDGGIVMTLKL